MTSPSTSGMSVSEVLDSVTGHDEIAVDNAFQIDLYTGNKAKPMKLPRALVFVLKRREGLDDHAAKEFALGLTVKDLDAYFEKDADELDPEEHESPLGSGSSELGSVPSDSGSGV